MTRSLRALAFLLAVTVPLLLNIPMPPAVTEPNMFAAVAGWGVVLLVLPRPEAGRRLLRIGRLPVAALGLCALACAWSLFRGTEGTDPALCTLALLGMSALLLCHGAGAGLRALPETFLPLAAALVVAGLGETVVGAFQVFAPRSTVGSLWASPSMWYPRAAANIGQPNHVADTLVWALAALVPLAEAARARRWRGATLVSAVVAVVLAGGIVLTNSRTGLLGVLMVAGWGALDRGLAGRHRLGMLALPLVTAVLWFLLSRWAATHHVSFSLVARDPRADISSFRFAIWRGALTLVAQNPWTGVGWGGFNFAWTLSPLGPRPAGYTDNAHDLLLHLAVELGVPAALLIVGLLAASLLAGAWRVRRIPGLDGACARAAALIVLMMGLHSLLEYPLWYAYLLLPTAWVWGVLLGAGRVASSGPQAPTPAEQADWPRRRRLWHACGALLVVSAFSAAVDYRIVAAVYEPDPPNAQVFANRLAAAQHSPLFHERADYMMVVAARNPAEVLPEIESAARVLVNSQLMYAWAQALQARGETDKARYLAARVREFDVPAGRAWMAPCSDPAVHDKPFQCLPPAHPVTWRDFR